MSWDDLPAEMHAIVRSYCDLLDTLFLSSTCRKEREHWKTLPLKGGPDEKWARSTVELVIKRGYTILFMDMASYSPKMAVSCFWHAAEANRIDYVKYLVTCVDLPQEPLPLGFLSLLQNSQRRGDLEMTLFLLRLACQRKREWPLPDSVVDYILTADSVALLEELHRGDHYAAKPEIRSSLVRRAIEHKARRCLKKLDEWGVVGPKCHRNVCSTAARTGCIELLKWLRERGCPWDKRIVRAAIEADSAYCLRYAICNGCPMELMYDTSRSPQCRAYVNDASLQRKDEKERSRWFAGVLLPWQPKSDVDVSTLEWEIKPVKPVILRGARIDTIF
jgi:hypothetical protein